MSEIKQLIDKKNYMIGVPSRARSSMMKKRTGLWRYIDPTKQDYMIGVFVREEETDQYAGSMCEDNLYACENYSSIAGKRQTIFKVAKEFEMDFLFIIDDDSLFFYREPKLSSLYSSKKEEFEVQDAFNRILYESMMLCGTDFPVVGLPLKLGSQSLKHRFPYNIPVIRFVCYHVPTLKKENLCMTDMGTTFMSDRYTQLFMLSRGYRSISNAWFAVDDYGTGYKGGCSVTRTVENQSLAARTLKKTFPGCVELKSKSNGHWDEARIDCKINWKGLLPDNNGFTKPVSMSAELGKQMIEQEGYKCL